MDDQAGHPVVLSAAEPCFPLGRVAPIHLMHITARHAGLANAGRSPHARAPDSRPRHLAA
jgi:hypothetical protein